MIGGDRPRDPAERKAAVEIAMSRSFPDRPTIDIKCSRQRKVEHCSGSGTAVAVGHTQRQADRALLECLRELSPAFMSRLDDIRRVGLQIEWKSEGKISAVQRQVELTKRRIDLNAFGWRTFRHRCQITRFGRRTPVVAAPKRHILQERYKVETSSR